MKKVSNCETCSNYHYDEEYGHYECTVGLDQDEMARFLQGTFHDCPYYSFDAEYDQARKQ